MSSESEKVIRRAGVVGFFTLISRVTGLLRDVAIAYAFGTRSAADAFFVAFRIPNLFRRLFAEGALTVSVVPVFSESLKRSREEARRVVGVSFTFMTVILIGVCLLGIFFSPWLVRLTAWGFSRNPEKFALTVTLTRLMFPYLLLVSLAALAMGILNALKHFASPAASSIFMNLGIIFGALALADRFHPPVTALGIGVLLGGVLQLGIQLPFLKRFGFWPRCEWNPAHPALKKMVGMMVPAAYGAAVYQFNVVLITLLASFLPTGSVSYLWYADRVMEFPLGVFAIAMATAVLPSLSDHAAEKDRTAFKGLFGQSLATTFFITIPAAVGLIVLAPPITRLLFERGSFLAASTRETSSALVFFAIGLPCIAGVRMTANAFFSLQDSKTPVRCANLSVVANAILALALIGPMRHNGLALSVSLSALLNFVLQLRGLRRKIGLLGLKKVADRTFRSLIAAVLMGGLLYGLRPTATGPWGLVWLIPVGAITYFGVSWLLRSPEAVQTVSRFLPRSRGAGR